MKLQEFYNTYGEEKVKQDILTWCDALRSGMFPKMGGVHAVNIPCYNDSGFTPIGIFIMVNDIPCETHIKRREIKKKTMNYYRTPSYILDMEDVFCLNTGYTIKELTNNNWTIDYSFEQVADFMEDVFINDAKYQRFYAGDDIDMLIKRLN